MNYEFINPFIEATVNVIKTMSKIDATAGEPVVKTDRKARGEVSGIISMAGEQAIGSLAVTFSESAILCISSEMLGEQITVLDETAADVVGEITNMVTGGAKRLLVEKGYKFELASPSVIIGKDHMIMHQTKAPIVLLSFSTNCGDFFVELCFNIF
ncbi:MAG: chemotaxis protein CheX [Nitrospirae bacterium]|nr:chemotaxis protein CheX [Nitrospirota bacterium]